MPKAIITNAAFLAPCLTVKKNTQHDYISLRITDASKRKATLTWSCYGEKVTGDACLFDNGAAIGKAILAGMRTPKTANVVDWVAAAEAALGQVTSLAEIADALRRASL